MKFWTITPTKFMKDALLTSDTTLVLFHLVQKGNDYQKACLEFKELGGRCCLDNSFYESRQNPAIKELVEKAKLINANIICLPDLPLQEGLFNKVKEEIKEVRELGYQGELMMCTFANNKNFQEDLAQFRILNEIEGLDIIAIPYVFRKNDEWRRPVFLNMVERSIGVKNVKKKIHLFGANSFPNLKEENRDWISSVDGSMPWKCGFAKMKLPLDEYEEPHRPENYFELDNLDEKQRECINFNCKLIKEECEGKCQN